MIQLAQDRTGAVIDVVYPSQLMIVIGESWLSLCDWASAREGGCQTDHCLLHPG